MSGNGRLRVAVVGLRFGRSFVPIYQAHPDVEHVGICDTNPERLAGAAKDFGISRAHASLEEVIAADAYDAVHILTPVATHAPLCVQALDAGMHCASAVPMGIGLDELEQVVEAQRRSGRNYMMMETAVYHRDYLFARQLHAQGKLGRIQFMRGCHSQDLEAFGIGWDGFPPMWYLTHALSPLLDLVDTRAVEVHCLGSGTMREELTRPYGNPYPIETALFRLEGTPAAAEITRTLFETAPHGGESFDIYGSEATFATIGGTAIVENDPLVPGQRRGHRVRRDVDIPYRPDLLPPELARFADGGHGGSHPHLVHEFLRSILEERPPHIDAARSANWCAPGLCAHESAMNDGAAVAIPGFIPQPRPCVPPRRSGSPRGPSRGS